MASSQESSEPGPVLWRLHVAASPDRVYQTLTTDSGRMTFWPETSREDHGFMELQFPGVGESVRCQILEQDPPFRFVFHYFGNTTVSIKLTADGMGGTDVALTETGYPTEEHRLENMAGWVSVLMNLKSVLDWGADLRNHDPGRTWRRAYCEG